ncbi:MAG: ABC transporter ATP-binding protein [Chloroflexi bacterium UTCFX4]|jgi:branched-chain amino acid transport system ATP-binding protein|nr:MAG: ABC transporter ATP-binding protein [Chloroflexi bacterium UTCFX4]
MLRVESIYKSFDDFMAVNGACLTVERGALVAVIGPNGAGKTTLFNLITGLHKPDRGKIIFEGQEIGGLAPYEICRRGIARAFQIANIFPRLSVFENVQVAVFAQQRQSRNLFQPAQRLARAETEEILENTGLQQQAQRVAGALSHGDQRILEIAIALGSQPHLLILDEPTAGMSPEETAKTMNLVQQLARARGITILFCEHDMDIVFSVAQSIMVMRHGETIIQGTPDEVRQNHQVQEAYLGGADA